MSIPLKKRRVVSPMEVKELTALSNMIDKLLSENIKKDDLALKLSEAQSIVNDLRLNKIPEFAATIGENGISSQTTGDGKKWEIVKDLKVGIPDYRMSEAVEYIKEKGVESIIKTNIVLNFDGEDIEELARLKSLLIENDFVFNETPSIHSGTLKAQVKEWKEKGVDDLEDKLFGVYNFKEVKVKGVKLK